MTDAVGARWTFRPYGLSHLALVRSGDGGSLAIDGRLIGAVGAGLLRPPIADCHALADTHRAAAWIGRNLPPESCHVLGKRRLLSLESDRNTYATAARLARLLQCRTGAPGHAQFPDAATYGLTHALAPRIRVLVELCELIERRGVTRVIAPITTALTLACLRSMLEAPVPSSRDRKSTGIGNPSHEIGQWPETPGLHLLEVKSRGRPFSLQAMAQLKQALTAAFPLRSTELTPPPAWRRLARFDLGKLASIYRHFRRSGLGRAIAWRIALPATHFESGMLVHLNAIGARFQTHARKAPDEVTIATNIARLPVLFALAGTRAGGGATAAIETTLVTRLDRYPSFVADRHFVIDQGQMAVLDQGQPGRIRAAGSVLIASRIDRIARIKPTRPTIVIASQPADREMRQILKLAADLPPDADVIVAPHAEDGPASRAWLGAMIARTGHPRISLQTGAQDPLDRASLIITATSNLAIVAQALSIPALLVAEEADLRDIWGDGPVPGFRFDPCTDDRSLFRQLVDAALAKEPCDYATANKAFLDRNVGERIVAGLGAS